MVFSPAVYPVSTLKEQSSVLQHVVTQHTAETAAGWEEGGSRGARKEEERKSVKEVRWGLGLVGELLPFVVPLREKKE